MTKDAPRYLNSLRATLLVLSFICSSNLAANETDEVADILKSVSANEQDSLPKPSRWNPSNWGLPDYARTPYVCKGDDIFEGFLEQLFVNKHRGKFDIHHLSSDGSGFVSVNLAAADENALDVANLTSDQISRLRSIISTRLGYIQNVTYFMTALSSAGGVPGLAEKAAGWGVFLLSNAISIGNSYISNITAAPLRTLSDQMLSDVQAYRLVLTPKSPEGVDYVRYIFAVKPARQKLLVLRNCVYPKQ